MIRKTANMAIHWPGKTYKACATRAMRKNGGKKGTVKVESSEL
jgi:hypothetical protein